MDQLAPILASGLELGAIYALTALAVHLLFQGTGLINFAQGHFVMLGTMLYWTFAVKFELHAVPAGMLTVVAVAAIGWIAYVMVLKPAKDAKMLMLIIATIGIAYIIQTACQFIWGPQPKAVPSPISPSAIGTGHALIEPQTILIVAGASAALAGVYLYFTRTLGGLAMLASAQNPKGGLVIGVQSQVTAKNLWVLAAAMSAFAGVLASPIVGARFDSGMSFTLLAFASAVLGGIGSAVGVVLGGLFIGLLQALVAGYWSSTYREAFVFGAFLLILVVRPWGLFTREGDQRA